MVELLTLLVHVTAHAAPYSAMCKVVVAFLFLILLRVTVPRIKVEGMSRWGWVVGWSLSVLATALAVFVWLLA